MLPEISEDTLNKIKMSSDRREFYSQENELKRVLIEREIYKRMFEEQQKRLDNFTKKSK